MKKLARGPSGERIRRAVDSLHRAVRAREMEIEAYCDALSEMFPQGADFPESTHDALMDLTSAMENERIAYDEIVRRLLVIWPEYLDERLKTQ